MIGLETLCRLCTPLGLTLGLENGKHPRHADYLLSLLQTLDKVAHAWTPPPFYAESAPYLYFTVMAIDGIAEEEAQKAPIKMVPIMVLTTLPAIGAVVLTPSFISLSRAVSVFAHK